MRAPDDLELALLTVGRWLRPDYAFTTVTPETHRRVVRRRDRARDVRDVFGWSLPFERNVVPVEIIDALRAAGALDEGELLRSRIRFSTLDGKLFVHSAHPTDHTHAVFFGPDSYRFCAALASEVTHAKRVVDLGAGSGVGGISVADRCERVTLTDVNPLAATYARVNAALNNCNNVEIVVGDLFAAVEGPIDLVIANPPYIADEGERVYCHGGGSIGTELAVRIIEQSIARLAPGGKLVLYTGAPICSGVDIVKREAARILTSFTYRELDPDVFGEELDRDAYREVERIAAVVLSTTRAA